MINLFCEDESCSTGNKWCVRRVAGMLGWCCCLVGMFTGVPYDTLMLIGSLSGLLMGLTTIDKILKK